MDSGDCRSTPPSPYRSSARRAGSSRYPGPTSVTSGTVPAAKTPLLRSPLAQPRRRGLPMWGHAHRAAACRDRDVAARCRSTVKRVDFSTHVAMAELANPRIRSPSQCPGTARSSMQAGRSLSGVRASQTTCFDCARAAWVPERRVRCAGRWLALCAMPAALPIHLLVDRFMADAHRSVVAKSINRRLAICSGLQACAHRRACLGPCRPPVHATYGPAIWGATIILYDRPCWLTPSKQSIGNQASRCCWPADPARNHAIRGSSAVLQTSGASQRGRHATAPCGHETQGRPRVPQHCAAIRARTLMAIDRTAWQSLERLLHGHVPAQTVPARPRQGAGPQALGRIAQELTQAYRRMVGASGCRRLATRRRLQLRRCWCVLVRSPSRTATARRDAARAAFRATAAWASAIDPISTSSASSTPPAGRVATTG